MLILACLDLSSVSDRVAAEAGALARATGAELTLLHAARTEPVLASGGVASPSGHRIPPADLADRKAKVGAMVERLRVEGVKVEGRVMICDDVLVRFILDEAAARKARYIVIGSHGHGRVFELLLGSVTQGMVREAQVPVLIVSARHL